MKHITTLIIILFISLISSPSFSETLTIDDLVTRDGLVFKKFTNVPFTGEITDHCNDNGYKTPRGHVFKGSHVHSILKKRRIREERINRPYELTFGDWYIRDA